MEGPVVRRTTRATAPASIEEDLRALWRTVARDAPVARAVMANLVVFVSDIDAQAGEVPLDDVVRRHPSRVIVLQHSREAAERPPTTASVSIVSFGPPHARYAVEEIAVRTTCGDASLASIVRRLTRGDLPTSLWWTVDCSKAAPIVPLARMVRQLVFDSSRWRDVGRGIAAIAPLLYDPHAPQLSDINWRRLTALRAALVHAARMLPPLPRELPRIEIRHRPGETALALLLTGWLASRLGWSDGAWPVEVQEVRHGHDVLAITVGPMVVSMNASKVVAHLLEGPAIAHTESRREPVAAAVAAELATLTPDTCLKDALLALARQPKLP